MQRIRITIEVETSEPRDAINEIAIEAADMICQHFVVTFIDTELAPILDTRGRVTLRSGGDQ